MWELAEDGALYFRGDVCASNFVVMDQDGRPQAALGFGPHDIDEGGPGLRVYADTGQPTDETVIALWRESWVGRSRLKIGDRDANPMQVIGNGLDALLAAANLRHYE